MASVCAASCHSCSLFLLNTLNDQSFSTEPGGNSAALSAGNAWGTQSLCSSGKRVTLGSGEPSCPAPLTEEQAPRSSEPGCLRRPPAPSPQAPSPAAAPRSVRSLPPLAATTPGLRGTAAETGLCPRPSERRKTHGKEAVAQGPHGAQKSSMCYAAWTRPAFHGGWHRAAWTWASLRPMPSGPGAAAQPCCAELRRRGLSIHQQQPKSEIEKE